MSEQVPSNDAGKKSDPEIASADLLFRDDPAVKPSNPVVNPKQVGEQGEVFDLAPGAEPEPESTSASAPANPRPATGPVQPRAAARPRGASPPRGEPSTKEDPRDLVDEVWSRWGEWGPTMLLIAAWIFVVTFLAYLFLNTLGIVMLLVLVGGAVAVILSYPILITLERPVRMTPEQALRDYYGALSHHLPHLRRMWLLLGKAGRTTSSYGSYEGFKGYWKEKLRNLKGNRAGSMTPLVFEVVEYRGDKSAGQIRVEAKFTLKISIRGHRQEGPIASIPAVISLVRGPDKMWYLETGTLPEKPRERKPIDH